MKNACVRVNRDKAGGNVRLLFKSQAGYKIKGWVGALETMPLARQLWSPGAKITYQRSPVSPRSRSAQASHPLCCWLKAACRKHDLGVLVQGTWVQGWRITFCALPWGHPAVLPGYSGTMDTRVRPILDSPQLIHTEFLHLRNLPFRPRRGFESLGKLLATSELH